MTDTLTIREMSEKFDVTMRTLRFYEQKELLAPRRLGQQRLYSQTEQARMLFISRATKMGVLLEQIRRLFEIYAEDGEYAFREEWRRVLQVREEEARVESARIAALERTIQSELADLMSARTFSLETE